MSRVILTMIASTNEARDALITNNEFWLAIGYWLLLENKYAFRK